MINLTCPKLPDAERISLKLEFEIVPLKAPVFPWVFQEIRSPACVNAGKMASWTVLYKHQPGHENLPPIGTVNDDVLDERQQKTAKEHQRGKEAGVNQGAGQGGYSAFLPGYPIASSKKFPRIFNRLWRAASHRTKVSWAAGDKSVDINADDATFIKEIKGGPGNLTVTVSVPLLPHAHPPVKSGSLKTCIAADDGYNLYDPVCASFEVQESCPTAGQGGKGNVENPDKNNSKVENKASPNGAPRAALVPCLALLPLLATILASLKP